MRPAFEQCLAVSKGEAWCALLMGGVGNGKTFLAIAALQAWFSRWGTGEMWKVPDFLDWLRRTAFGGNGSPELEELLRPYRQAPHLLVMDDLGVENRTDWACEQLYRVLDARYEYRLPTIITTNLGPNGVDARLFSRYRQGLVICRSDDARP